MKGYIREFDSLRAISVLAVMLQHYLGQFKFLSVFGSCGVTMFFVLSGYLITQILFFEKNKFGIDASQNTAKIGYVLKVFYFRRSLRIFPIYYITLIILFIFSVDNAREYAGYHLFYLSNFLYSFKVNVLTQATTLSHFWSLSVEEQFYLLWPLLILLFPIKRNITFLLIFLIITSVFFKFYMVHLYSVESLAWYFLMPSCIESFACGAIVLQLNQRQIGKPMLVKGLFLTGILFAGLELLAFAKLTPFITVVTAVLSRTIFSLFSGIVILIVLSKSYGSFIGKTLNNKYLVLTGKISYGIYIYHHFIPEFLEYIQKKFNFSLRGMGILIPMAFLLTFVISYLSYRFIEAPINKQKRKFAY